MLVKYTLYKNPVQKDTLAIVQYLYYIGKPTMPTVIVERGWPDDIQLPAVFDHKACKLHEGIDNVVKFYEDMTDESPGLLDRVIQFVNANPDYRIQ